MAEKTKKKISIGLIVLGVIVIATGFIAVFYGQLGQLFRGAVTEHEISCPTDKGLTISFDPYNYWGITDEQCECDLGRHFVQNPQVPTSANCGEDGDEACLRLEEENTPCVCEQGYEKEGNKCVLKCPDHGLAKPGVIEASAPYTFRAFQNEMCICDTANHWVLNPSIPTSMCMGDDPTCLRLEDETNPCVCEQGYSEQNGECVSEDGVSVSIIVPGLKTEKVAGVEEPSIEEEPPCIFNHPLQDMCVAGGECIPNSHLEGNRCYCDSGFVFNEDKLNPECEPEAPQLGEPPVAEEEATPEPEITEEEPVLDEPVIATCEDFEEVLSIAFYNQDWTLYSNVMQDMEDNECYTHCVNNFYWTILYISLRDIIMARDYYTDPECTDCEMATDLSSYASEEYSDPDVPLTQTDKQLLRELINNNLDYCPKPESFEDFINSLIFDAVKYFGTPQQPQAKKYNTGLAHLLFPTAYAQSSPFSEDVEDVIQEAYEEKYGPEFVPECRSLEIIRPEDAVGDMPVVMIPQTGFVNEELAIQVDEDDGAVALYRYKSLEATITFDDEGTIYDTEATSVLMNSRDTSKGDIVTVWALDNELNGIQECHDAFYVEIETPPPPEPAPEPEPEPVAAPTPAPEPTPLPEEEVPLHAAAAPTAFQAPEGMVAFQAAPPQTVDNGPGIFYLIGVGLAVASFRKRKKK